MPVHEIRYQAWEGRTTSALRRLIAIPKFSLLSIFNKWLAVSMFGLGSLQLLVYSMYIVLLANPLIQQAVNLSTQQMIVISPDGIFRRFLMVQVYFCLMTLLIAAPRMISQDRAHKGLPLIYSRPVSRMGYIGGKFAALGVILAYMTAVQVLVLFVVMWTNYPAGHMFQTSFFSYSLPLLVRTLLACAMIVTTLSAVALATSAASSDVRYATIMFLVLLFGASFISQTAQKTFAPTFPELGVREILFAANDKLVDASQVAEPTRFESQVRRYSGARILWGQASDITTTNVIIGFIFWTGVSILFMRWRLRPFDVHGA